MIIAITDMLTAWFVAVCTMLSGFLLTKKKGKYLLYMTITEDQRQNKEVIALVSLYKKRMYQFTGVLFLSSALFFIYPDYSSLQIFILTVWITFCLLGEFKIIRTYTGKLYELKKEKGWLSAKVSSVRKVDTEVTAGKKVMPVSFLYFALPIWLVIGETLWFFMSESLPAGMLILLITNYLFLALFIYLYRKAAHMSSRVYCSDSEINKRLNRLSKRRYTCCVIIEAIIQSAFFFVMLLMLSAQIKEIKKTGNGAPGFFLWFIIVNVMFAVISIIVFILSARKVNKEKAELLSGKQEKLPEDEDAAWKNGFYFNPYDPSGFVENRVDFFSTGITVNMATGAGKASKYLLIGTFIFCLLLSGAVLPLDFGKVTASSSEKGIKIKACVYYKAFIPYEEVETVTMLSECPELSRIFGSGMKEVALGDYHMEGFGSGKAYITRKAEAFLIIQKKNGGKVFLSVKDTDQVNEIYCRLQKKNLEKETQVDYY